MGKFNLTVSVKDVLVGSKAAEANLKRVFGVSGTASLDSDFKEENVEVSFGQPENGQLKLTAEPKDNDAKSFFMQMKIK